ncbi:MAG: excinuclease ABC subunit UvrA, partial [bacterium]
NNLKNIDIDIPLNKITVVTGLSGSGKSSLVFDTIYAEARRKYFESLSYYARQFLGDIPKPDVEKIEGLSPAISIDQKIPFRNPRSTLGTITEIYDLLRILFAKLGRPHCPNCNLPLRKIKPEAICEKIIQEMAKTAGTNCKIIISALIKFNQESGASKILEELLDAGFSKIFIGKNQKMIKDVSIVDLAGRSDFEVVIDTIIATSDEIIEKNRLLNSLRTAFNISSNIIAVYFPDRKEVFSNKNICLNCSKEFPEILLGTFSFNSPEGACAGCTGLGKKMKALPELVIPNDSLTIAEGAIKPWRKMGAGDKILKKLAETYNFSLNDPVKNLGKGALKVLFYGEDIPGGFEGVLKDVEKRYIQASSDFLKNELEEYLAESICSECGGKRLNPFALAALIGRRNINEIVNLQISDLESFFSMDFQFSEEENAIAEAIIAEIRQKVATLKELGLGYLSLARTSENLSGGEIQRARLARQLGAGLSGIIYVLDEPTVGLHQKDVGLVVGAL